jgi:SAM-dependent methyltransferase
VAGEVSDPAVGPTAAWRPLGAALLDFHRGDTEAEIVVTSDLWEPEPTPVAAFYRPDDQPLPAIERDAVGLCRGRVLDLGAGAGRHSLALQQRGHQVVAVDPLPEAVSIMRDRGVDDPRLGDLGSVTGERFDTIVMLMHGVGIAGDIHGLGVLFETAHQLLEPGGRLVFDSADLLAVLENEAPELLDERNRSGRYVGEVEFQLSYRDMVGPAYPWLFVDPTTLACLGGAAGFRIEIVRRGERGSYLALLEPVAT